MFGEEDRSEERGAGYHEDRSEERGAGYHADEAGVVEITVLFDSAKEKVVELPVMKVESCFE